MARQRAILAADYSDYSDDGQDDLDVDADEPDEAAVADAARTLESHGSGPIDPAILASDFTESDRGRARAGARADADEDEDEDELDEMDLDDYSDDDYAYNEDDIDADDMESFRRDLKLAAGFSSRKGGAKGKRQTRGRVARGEQEPSEEVKMLLGLANQAYATNDLDEAENILAEIIRIDHHVYAAWKTLGEIHKQRGDIQKCLLSWISAGHLRLKDGELWSICGKLSMETGQIDQALYCYNRAILANGQDVEAIFERGLVFKEMGNLPKAFDAFRKLHDMLPNDLTVVRELASIYVTQRNIPTAARLYEDILAESKRQKKAKGRPVFGWSELNILAELYGRQDEYLKAIRFIKSTARWLLGRADETFWDDAPDDDDESDAVDHDTDAEFDDRRQQNAKFRALPRATQAGWQDRYRLPLDLRAKLALYRLRLGHVDEALVHAAILTEAPPSQYADLYLDVGEALMEADQFEAAMSLFYPLADIEEYSTGQLVMFMGRCLRGLGDFEQAEAAYQTVIASDGWNLEARVALAEVYEATGRRHEALELVNEVLRLRKEHDKTAAAGAGAAAYAEPDRPSESSSVTAIPSFIPNADAAKAKAAAGAPAGAAAPAYAAKYRKPGRPSKSERLLAEEQAAQNVRKKLKTLRKYQDGMLQRNNIVANSEWLQTASELVDMFTGVRAFYPSDRGKVFRGFNIARHRARKLDFNKKLEGMASRLQEGLDLALPDDDTAVDVSEFRGLDFEGWFDIFMQYALTLSWNDDDAGSVTGSGVDDAYHVLRSAKDANVFHQDKHREWVMSLVHLACALRAGDLKTAVEVFRALVHLRPFDVDIYKMVYVALPSGTKAIELFSMTNNQKYLLRHVKGIDSRIEGKHISGSYKVEVDPAAPAVAETDRLGRERAILLTLYGHVLAMSRSYVSSLAYYMRAFAVVPNDPMVLLSIGMAHIHRAMQRQTNNRHLQIVQGLSFLMNYYSVRCRSGPKEVQEANYNVARTFHLLGLPSLAVPYYERAIEIDVGDDDMYNLRFEATYNLQLIYVVSGNSRYARELVDRYLVI
ncbi:uncharacterized protein V1510DRAFT_443573 [Dipodascopsis tothii]|uniref:uncharacterized protein n=1 Tax=Dipodascopsis tothii TaxID=44089 RepID=UPI0034CE5E34